MSVYTPVYKKPYPDGWVNAPPEETPVTAEILDAYDAAIENIETYLQENPAGSVDDNNGLTDLGVSNSISVGDSATVSGKKSMAVGEVVEATGNCAIASGFYSEARGTGSVAIGEETYSGANYSYAEGSHTVAAGVNQHVQGRYNIIDNRNRYAHIVGNGKEDIYENVTRSNAHTLDWEGNAWYAGTMECKGLVLTDTDDSTRRYLVQITGGQLALSEITGVVTT